MASIRILSGILSPTQNSKGPPLIFPPATSQVVLSVGISLVVVSIGLVVVVSMGIVEQLSPSKRVMLMAFENSKHPSSADTLLPTAKPSIPVS